MSLRYGAIAALLVAGALAAQAPRPDNDVIVTTDWLAAHRADPTVVVLQVGLTDSAYRAGHLPGARFVRYQAFIANANGNATELPSPDSLRSLFEGLGVSNGTHVVLTGPPLETSRAFYTLDYLGLAGVSVLDGGTTKWKQEHRPIDDHTATVSRGHLTTPVRPSVFATAEWISARAGRRGLSIIDTRREDEYLGVVAASAGHIAGARRLEWQEMFRDQNEFWLKDRAELEKMWRERAAPGDTVVAYCRVGHRSSATYLVSRFLGYPARLYDGSYEDWARRGLPLVRTATPIR